MISLGANTDIGSHAIKPFEYNSINNSIPSRSILLDFKQKLQQKLQIALNDANDENINTLDDSFIKAKYFIEILCFSQQIDLPSIGVEESGNLLFEWYKKNSDINATIFSIIFSRENYIFSLFKNGNNDTCGVLNYSNISREIILRLIQENFGVQSDARSRAH
jgi:hypothetical protein